jgi:hypothetical protein
MDPAWHYLVETLFWRRAHIPGNTEMDVQLEGKPVQRTAKVFEADQPILARERAFSHLSSIIDVMYEGIGMQYTTDEQARIDLQPYFDSGNAFEMSPNNPERRFKVTLDMMNSVCISLVISYPGETDKKPESFCIYSIGFVDYPDRLDWDVLDSLESLAYESIFYDKFGFSRGQKTEDLDLKGIGGRKINIMSTPYNWENLILDFDGRQIIGSGILKSRYIKKKFMPFFGTK